MNIVGAFNLYIGCITSNKLTRNEYKNIKVGCFYHNVFIIPMIHRLTMYEDNNYDKIIKSHMMFFVAFVIFSLVLFLFRFNT